MQLAGLENLELESALKLGHLMNIYMTKQSSPYFQTVACHNNITYNVMYNGPRAGINFVRQPS